MLLRLPQTHSIAKAGLGLLTLLSAEILSMYHCIPVHETHL